MRVRLARVGRSVVALAALAAGAGCTLVLDPTHLRPAGDAGPTLDARVRDAGTRLDAADVGFDSVVSEPDAVVGMDRVAMRDTIVADVLVPDGLAIDASGPDLIVVAPDTAVPDADVDASGSMSSCPATTPYTCETATTHACGSYIALLDRALAAASDTPCCSDADCVLGPSADLCCSDQSYLAYGHAYDCVIAALDAIHALGISCPASCGGMACMAMPAPLCLRGRCGSG